MKFLLIFIFIIKLNESNSVLYRALKTIKESDLNDKCYNELLTTKNEFDIKKTWAQKMIDSSGSENSGFMMGNNFWFGSRAACDMIESPEFLELDYKVLRDTQENIIGSKAPFNVTFWMIHAKYNTTNQFDVHCFSKVFNFFMFFLRKIIILF